MLSSVSRRAIFRSGSGGATARATAERAAVRTDLRRHCPRTAASCYHRRTALHYSTTTALAAATATSSPPPTLDGASWVDNKVYKYFTKNQFVKPATTSTSNNSIDVLNPATQDVVATITENSDEEFNTVVERSQTAFEQWSMVPVQQRQRIMFEYQRLVRLAQDDLAQLITLENGKTIDDAKGDVFRGLEVVETACHVAPQLLGDALMGIASSMDCTSYRVPLGVCAGICPFNFPAMIPMWMFPLAIACGNTFVIKPSEKTPSATLKLAELAAEAGLPDNVLQVVHGGKDTVNRICHHPDIKAISFVGSNMAGEYIFREGTAHGKRVQSNLGAKNHAVVLPDADRRATCKAVAGAAFGAAGQRCMALSTLIVVGNEVQQQDFIDDIVKEGKKLTVGAGWAKDTDVGPLISTESKQRVHEIVTKSIDANDGTELLLDGRNTSVQGYPSGNFFGPTVLSDVSIDSIAYREEIFGPVLVCLKADTLEDAISIINSNQYGNGCALFTSSGGTARKFVSEIEVGQVGINVPVSAG